MTIDAEKLEEAVAECVRWLGVRRENCPDGLKVVVAFAEDHLATLPRYKEVEVAQWASVDHAGEVHGVWDHESQARDSVGLDDGLSVVRLTGTAKVKVTP